MTRKPASQSGRERRSRDADSGCRYPSSGNYASSYADAEISPSYVVAPSSSSSAPTAYRIYDYDSMPSGERHSKRERERESDSSRKHRRSRVEPSSAHLQPPSHHYASSSYDRDLIKSLEDVTIRESEDYERRSKKKDREPSRRSKKDAYQPGSSAPSTHEYHYKEDFILYPPTEHSYDDRERAYPPSDGHYDSRPAYSYGGGGGEYLSPSKPPRAPRISRIPTPEFADDVPDGMFGCCDGSSSCSNCGGYRY